MINILLLDPVWIVNMHVKTAVASGERLLNNKVFVLLNNWH